MYNITLRIIPANQKTRDYVLRPLDVSYAPCREIPFTELIDKLRPKIAEAVEGFKAEYKNDVDDLKLFYIDATGNSDESFSFWIDKTTFNYIP